jgi:cytochrome P450
VVHESLRLYPPAVRAGYRALRPVAIGGVTVPAESSVFVGPYVTQRDHRWFEAPDTFRPGRWLGPRGYDSLTYFPFGWGPRSCVGEHFARVVLRAAVIGLCQTWRFEIVGRRPIRVRSMFTLKPAGGTRLEPIQWKEVP